MSESFFKQSYRPPGCTFVKKETLAQVFSCKFCEICKKTYFEKHLRTAALVLSSMFCSNNTTDVLVVFTGSECNKKEGGIS